MEPYVNVNMTDKDGGSKTIKFDGIKTPIVDDDWYSLGDTLAEDLGLNFVNCTLYQPSVIAEPV